MTNEEVKEETEIKQPEVEKAEVSVVEKPLTPEEYKKLKLKKTIRQYVWVSIGVLLVDLAFYFFLDPAAIDMGGTTGLSVVFENYFGDTTWFSASVFLYITNTICLFLGLIFIGKDYFFKTIYASVLSPTLVLLFEKTMDANYFYDRIEETPIFICFVCGAFLMGVGVGVAVKANGSTGGMDVIQKIISKYFRVPISMAMYSTDMIIVIIGGFIFQPSFSFELEKTIYGAVGVFAVGFITDVIALSIRPRRTLYAITDHAEQIKELIYKELDRGVTFNNVVGSYTGKERIMVICTMDKNEAYRMTSLISELDPKAFIFVTSCKEVRGEYTKRGIF